MRLLCAVSKSNTVEGVEMVTSQITPGAFVRLSSFSVPPEEKVATAMLIDHGKRVVTGAAEVAVIGLEHIPIAWNRRL